MIVVRQESLQGALWEEGHSFLALTQHCGDKVFTSPCGAVMPTLLTSGLDSGPEAWALFNRNLLPASRGL